MEKKARVRRHCRHIHSVADLSLTGYHPRRVKSCGCVQGIIEKHFDERSELEKMEQRRGYLENI